MKVLRTDLVKRPVEGSLYHGPQGLDPVGVGHAVDVLGNRVLDGFVGIGNALIGGCIVCVYHGVRVGHVVHEALQRGPVGGFNDLRCDLVGGTALGPYNRRHVDGTATLKPLALRIRLVLALSTHVCFVKLNRVVERAVAVITAPCFSNARHHEPCGRLGNADVPAQLHRGHGLEVRHAQVDGDGPLAKRDLRPLHRGLGLDREVTPAVAAPVRHVSVTRLARVLRPALRAMATVRPNDGLKPFRRGFFGREHVYHLNDGESFALRLSGGWLRHSDLRLLLPTISGGIRMLSTFLCKPLYMRGGGGSRVQ